MSEVSGDIWLAAQLAGMLAGSKFPDASRHELITVLEPEAASIFCMRSGLLGNKLFVQPCPGYKCQSSSL